MECIAEEDRKFPLRGSAYIRDKARVGILERIVIKYYNPCNYQDTFNRLWLEFELVDLEEAELLISNFGDL